MAEYKTVRKNAQDQFVEKRSRFIGYACPVQTEQEALDFITSKKSEHWDASHNVYAYILRDGTMRFSDDGEPQGTAGFEGIVVSDAMNMGAVTQLCTPGEAAVSFVRIRTPRPSPCRRHRSLPCASACCCRLPAITAGTAALHRLFRNAAV